MRIALIQDQLLTQAGSERVFLHMAREFLEADLFTLCYNPKRTWPEFEQFEIRTSWLNRFVTTHDQFKACFPLGTRVMEAWDFRGYDVIVTSSATTAKYVRRFNAPHICYCYFPTRAIWGFDGYFGDSPGLRGRVFGALLPYFKRRDLEAASRVSRFVAISEVTRAAIRDIYGRTAQVLFSPVDVDRFRPGAVVPKQGHYLLVSRLERWKLVDYAIHAFNTLGYPLRVVGEGSDEERLRALANDNIEFLGALDDESLVFEYGAARAVVFTPELEYGLVPLEANAAGTPVIALGRGGVLETMIGNEDVHGRAATAVLFGEPTPESLMDAVRRFEGMAFDAVTLQGHAALFGVAEFQKRLRRLVEDSIGLPSGHSKQRI